MILRSPNLRNPQIALAEKNSLNIVPDWSCYFDSIPHFQTHLNELVYILMFVVEISVFAQ